MLDHFKALYLIGEMRVYVELLDRIIVSGHLPMVSSSSICVWTGCCSITQFVSIFSTNLCSSPCQVVNCYNFVRRTVRKKITKTRGQN